jgi:hypothetical protein
MVGKGLIISTKTKGDFKYTAHESVKEKTVKVINLSFKFLNLKSLTGRHFFPSFLSCTCVAKLLIIMFVRYVRGRKTFKSWPLRHLADFSLDVGSGFRIHFGKSKK